MRPPSDRQAGSAIVELLAGLLDAAPDSILLRENQAGPDYSIELAGHCFVAEYKSSASAGRLAAAVGQLRWYAAGQQARLPLIVVPFMGRVGRDVCERAGVSWLDLSGNAGITAPGLRIRIEGRPNKFSARGRPPNVFAPKSSRVARQLLLEPQRYHTQAGLARQTGLDDGYVSKIVRRLEQERYLEVNGAGAVRPRGPDLLLDAWHGVYDFSRHRILKGHAAARSGEETLHKVVRQLSQRKHVYAATGLAAAWLFTGFAAFRLTVIYLASMPTRPLLAEMGFSDEPRGANLWIVLPDDEGVFQGSREQGGIQCVSAVQAYLDLKGQPERAKDAAVELRKRFLNWGRRGT